MGTLSAHWVSSRLTVFFIGSKKAVSEKLSDRFIVLALPIFPGRRQPSIVGAGELNYRVRNGNGWTLTVIDTDNMVHLQGLEPWTP